MPVLKPILKVYIWILLMLPLAWLAPIYDILYVSAHVYIHNLPIELGLRVRLQILICQWVRIAESVGW